MNRFSDDWGTAIGDDPENPKPTKDSPKKKRQHDPDSRTGLVLYFNQNIPVDMKRIGANVNGPVMLKYFKILHDKDFTSAQIRGMIDLFVQSITRRPLPSHIAPWRAFISDIDKYADLVQRATTTEGNNEVEVDDRLL
jgi:hypothetical protein